MKQQQSLSLKEAQEKFHEWGVLLLLDVPAGIEFGIDNTSWKVGDKFKGVKLIPPGPHFIHYSLKNEEHKFKLGFFIHVGKKKRIFVRKWNAEKEDFMILPSSDEEDRYAMGVNSYQFDEFLGPYPMDRLQIWQECSNYITESVLDELNPIERKVHILEEEYKNQNYTSSIQQNKIDSLVMEFIQSSSDQQEQSQQQNQQINLESQRNPTQNHCNNFQQYFIQNLTELQNNNNNIQKNKIIIEQEKMDQEVLEDIVVNKQQNNNDSEMNLEQNEEIISENKTNTENQCNNNNRHINDIKNEIIADGAKEDFRVMAGTIYYTDLPKIRSQYGKKGGDITQLNLDKTPILKQYYENRQKLTKNNLLKKKGNISEKDIQEINEQEKYFIFGEFQYSFVMLLLLEDFDSFEHWKNIFSILISSDKYMEENPEFYIEFIPVLYNLLKQFPRDFFIDAISKDNFLKSLLSDFIEVTSQSQNKKLSSRSKRLQMLLEEYFLFFPKKNIIEIAQGQYKFDQEDEEDTPQIVDDENPNYF